MVINTLNYDNLQFIGGYMADSFTVKKIAAISII
jgi:hypothetical protein